MTDQPRCLICDEYIAFFQDGVFDMPIDAVIIEIPGNHGSRLYDSVGGEHLSGYLCDQCLAAKITQGRLDRIEVIRLDDTIIRHPYTVPGD